MNKSQMAKLAAAAGVNGLMYDPNAEGVFGNVQGYTVTIMPNANNRVYYMLSLSVSRMGMAPNPADFKPLEKMNKVLSGCTVQRFRVNFLVKLSGNKDKMAEALHSALDTLITFLRTNGYTNCCEHCGRPEGVDAYTVSGNAYLLCEPCFGQVSEAAAQQNQTKMQKQEQVLPGIVGALIGSLIGAVVIVIVGQLGYVAAVSGLVMAICTLKGYEMLGKKLGTPGIIISCVLMLLMIFLAYQADWSITAAQFYETDFFTAFRAMMDLIKEGYVDSGDYFGGLAQVYLFAVIGAVPTIIAMAKGAKHMVTTAKMRSAYAPVSAPAAASVQMPVQPASSPAQAWRASLRLPFSVRHAPPGAALPPRAAALLPRDVFLRLHRDFARCPVRVQVQV